MIQEIRIQNFRSLRDVTLKLQQVSLLIGPNNSGKTNVLKALKFFSEMLDGKVYSVDELQSIIYSKSKTLRYFPENFIEISIKEKIIDENTEAKYQYSSIDNNGLSKIQIDVEENDYVLVQFSSTNDFCLKNINNFNLKYIDSISDSFHCIYAGDFRTELQFGGGKYIIEPAKEILVTNVPYLKSGLSYTKHLEFEEITKNYSVPQKVGNLISNRFNVRHFLEANTIYKVNPEELLKPFPLNNEGFVNSDASNIVSFFDVIYSNHREIATRITEDLNRFIPEFKEVVFERVEIDEDNPLRLTYGKNNKKSTDTFKKLGLKDNNGNTFWADELSEGTLYFLALLCIIHQPNPPRLLLLEEPEKGIHPRRLRETLDLIFELAEEKDIQVIMTTHSPYVVDYFSDIPESVFVLEKDEKETVVKNLADEINCINSEIEKNGGTAIDFTSSLGMHWSMGFLGGVPHE